MTTSAVQRAVQLARAGALAGLAAAAIVNRRRTQWHRRLMFCAMASLTGPGFGRLLPVPLLVPLVSWSITAVVLLFPIAGVIRDLRRAGKVHPAWWWGIATIVAMQIVIDLVAYGSFGQAIYWAATAESPGAAVAPLVFSPAPPM